MGKVILFLFLSIFIASFVFANCYRIPIVVVADHTFSDSDFTSHSSKFPTVITSGTGRLHLLFERSSIDMDVIYCCDTFHMYQFDNKTWSEPHRLASPSFPHLPSLTQSVFKSTDTGFEFYYSQSGKIGMMIYDENSDTWETNYIWSDTFILGETTVPEYRSIETLNFGPNNTTYLLWQTDDQNLDQSKIGQYVITIDQNWETKDVFHVGAMVPERGNYAPFTFVGNSTYMSLYGDFWNQRSIYGLDGWSFFHKTDIIHFADYEEIPQTQDATPLLLSKADTYSHTSSIVDGRFLLNFGFSDRTGRNNLLMTDLMEDYPQTKNITLNDIPEGRDAAASFYSVNSNNSNQFIAFWLTKSHLQIWKFDFLHNIWELLDSLENNFRYTHQSTRMLYQFPIINDDNSYHFFWNQYDGEVNSEVYSVSYSENSGIGQIEQLTDFEFKKHDDQEIFPVNFANMIVFPTLLMLLVIIRKCKNRNIKIKSI
ncbi:MAG: hypothetical protein ACXAD7_15515 [Candidatus Kariarchaeaceae archaeon]|jgi:hypothetical protein